MAARKTPARGSKDRLIRDALMIALHREVEGADGKRTRKLQELAERWVEVALEGDEQAMIAIADRIDGKPVQQVIADVNNTVTVGQDWVEELPPDTLRALARIAARAVAANARGTAAVN